MAMRWLGWPCYFGWPDPWPPPRPASMTVAQRFEALHDGASRAVAFGCRPDELLSAILAAVAGRPALFESLGEYLKAHPARVPGAGASIGPILNFVATQSAEMSDRVLDVVISEIEHTSSTDGVTRRHSRSARANLRATLDG